MKYVEVCYGKKDRGKVIPKRGLDLFGQEYIGPLYTSVFDHTEALVTHVKNNSGSVKGYNGPVSCDWFPFDFDGDTALEDARTLFEYSISGTGDTEAAYVAFSGSKGFHVFVRTSKYKTPSSQTCKRMKAAAKKIKENLGLETLDLALYKNTGIIRVTNSQHERTGLFKVPLFASELYTCTLDDITKIAEKKRCLRDRATIRELLNG